MTDRDRLIELMIEAHDIETETLFKTRKVV